VEYKLRKEDGFTELTTEEAIESAIAFVKGE
jgi:hypothetical protein